MNLIDTDIFLIFININLVSINNNIFKS